MKNSRIRVRIWISVMIVVLSIAVFPALADGKLSGSVQLESGEPLIGVSLKLVPLDESLPTLEISSKKNGRFLFGWIRPGKYRLLAFHEGMRVSWIDVNLGDEKDDSVWDFEGALPYGAEAPEFKVTGLTTVTYYLKMAESMTGPGEYGTGEPLSPVDTVIKAIESGRWDEADQAIRQHLSQDPESATFNYLLGFAMFSRERWDEAQSAVEKALSSDPALEGACLLKGKILERKGEPEAAIPWYEKEVAIANSPQVIQEAYLALAVAAENSGDHELAQTSLEALVAIAPDQIMVYRELANLYLQSGRAADAQAMLDKVMELGGEQDPYVLFNMGADRFNAGDSETAAAHYRTAIELKPDFADAYYQLGMTMLNIGDLPAAVENFKKYLELEPEGSHAPTATALVEQLAAN
jgi:tetratricopeptide (TPR) repeat protein